MLSLGIQRCLTVAFAILLILQASGASFAEVTPAQWREASPTRVIIDSTADWARVLFDDLNSTNSNGLRIKSVVSSGWLEGRESDDQLYAGRKIPWPDTEYDKIVVRKGDMVAFFKGLNDFHPIEVYADLILEVNVDLPRVYIWLMTGGNGTTSVEIVSQDTGETIWRDIVVAAGETQQVKRVMSPQTFFHPGRTETSVVVTWISIVTVVIVVLNFPIIEAFGRLFRRKKTPEAASDSNRSGDQREEAAGQT